MNQELRLLLLLRQAFRVMLAELVYLVLSLEILLVGEGLALPELLVLLPQQHRILEWQEVLVGILYYHHQHTELLDH
jgi:hypothetical protein